MSTKLTKKVPQMVDSYSLQLVLEAAKTNEQIFTYLSKALKAKGYKSATPSVLHFVSALECGVNYASDIARRLGISRQMAAKTSKELCRMGYLQQKDAVGKQKQIVFTKLGEQLVSDARKALAELDEMLDTKIGKNELKDTVNYLEAIHSNIRIEEKE